ncbi:MAG: SAM-dependent methyltransferase HcgC family protein [Methanobrevibacter sp.]|uniref:SAM-dependent methyltransferase HcgC family protein n=1 Tax=Methanobrevibacter sp. TaxID=66852 RepID=UPI0026DEFB88|nr:SAM-dependent methyltransferase HcgC family protein [Methanobrevibacter sp.]MDO5848403.1 SAM-dependent methyltransferase HcgC family protein [Methanobrevibacter sp.]
MTVNDFDTGITDEVFTIKSTIKLLDIFDEIIEKKSAVCYDWAIQFEKTDKVVVIGTYFTGIGIVKKLSKYFDEVLLVDIYPHLEEFIDSPIGESISQEDKSKIKFSSDLSLIYSGDIVIDTTGFGGINEEQSAKFDVKGFLIEDPVAEDNDRLLENKNNIHERLSLVKSPKKAILKTKGLDTKTSGTMTLTIGVLTSSINKALSIEGVLYAACEMGFFEELIFKKKDIVGFFQAVSKEAMKISTINLFECDEILKEEISAINSEIIIQD